jgi:formylglycine-generating enzyme required for sulfatase activity
MKLLLKPVLFILGLAGMTLLAWASVTPTPGVSSPRLSCQVPDRSQIHIPGGRFKMGSTAYYEEEGPVRDVSVASFSIDRFAVTNAEFARFVAATHYLTDAEKTPDPADYPEIDAARLVAGGAVFTSPTGVRTTEDPMQWWAFVPGAEWRHPEGPGSSIAGRDDDPVVQVSYSDARAYARWAGRDLPTEAQFEYAARGGLDGKTYAWGDELAPDGRFQANTWQGEFPNHNTGADGFAGRAPVGCFPPNGYGLYDMIGNVWEWTSSLYAGDPSTGTPSSRIVRTIKGGSFLCAPNYCRRYRPAARQAQESGFSALHLGFRTVTNTP